MPVNATATSANRAVKAIFRIRILVSWVFLSEGIQKFLFPDSLGVGRFVKIGIPWPQFMAPFVGVLEIVCGSAVDWSCYAAGDGAPYHRYRYRFVLDQNRGVGKERILGNAA
jgi:hypothetical protein